MRNGPSRSKLLNIGTLCQEFCLTTYRPRICKHTRKAPGEKEPDLTLLTSNTAACAVKCVRIFSCGRHANNDMGFPYWHRDITRRYEHSSSTSISLSLSFSQRDYDPLPLREPQKATLWKKDKPHNFVAWVLCKHCERASGFAELLLIMTLLYNVWPSFVEYASFQKQHSSSVNC